MTLSRVVILAFATVIGFSLQLSAQTKLPPGATRVPTAEFYRVDAGVFALRPGMSIDLTDRKILLTFTRDTRQFSRGRFDVLLNGDKEATNAGERIDLKRERSTRDFVADKAQCFLDVLSFVAPKGAPATATFRLNCI